MQRIFQQDQFLNPTQCMNAQVFVLAQGRAWQPRLLRHSQTPSLRSGMLTLAPQPAVHYGNAHHQTAGNTQIIG